MMRAVRWTGWQSRGLRVAIAVCAVALLGTSLAGTSPRGAIDRHLTDRGLAESVERFTASAVTTSPIGQAITTTIEISIDRWSTDAERDRLVTTLKQRGPDALLEQLRALPQVGYISTPQSKGWALHFARSTPLDEGRRQVTIATDRPLAPDERPARGRTVDYPFSLLDIRFDAQGIGTGKIAYASNLAYNTRTGTIEIEKYGQQPVRLSNVRSIVASQ
jgi:hypothetical protein